MTTKRICLIAMGTALFVVLSLCLQVPVFENYYLCLGYAAMMVFCYYYGSVDGMIVGGLGVILYCLLISGLRGMPGWAVGNLVIGAAMGITCKLTRNMENQWLRHGLLTGMIVLSTAVAILGVKSFVEVVLYAQPMAVRVAKNVYAFIADVVVMVVSLPICVSLKGIVRKLQ